MAVRSGQNLETCCMCIPLRLGVFLNAVMTIFGSLMMVFFKQYAEETMRLCGGGYVLFSRVVIRFIEVTGVFWGVMGLLGAWQLKEGYLEIYNMYQMTRCIAWVGMYVTDLPILWNCEMWILDINGAIKKYGWNEIMYKIALAGRCQSERTYFILFSTAGLMFFLYLTWVNQRLQNIIGEENKYLIRLPQGATSSAFFQESRGEKRHLLSIAKGNEAGVVGQTVRVAGRKDKPKKHNKGPQDWNAPSHDTETLPSGSPRGSPQSSPRR